MKNIIRLIIVTFIISATSLAKPEDYTTKQKLYNVSALLKNICTNIFSWGEPDIDLHKINFTRNSKNAFSYLHFKTKKASGYAVVSDTQSSSVLEEFSIAGMPSLILNDTSFKIARNSAGTGRIVKKPETIYLAPSFFILNYPFYQDNKLLGNIAVDVIEKKAINLTSPKEAKHDETITNIEETSSRYLSDINVFPSFISNEASCIAMIFDYWEKNGFPNIRQLSQADPSRKETNLELIAAIAKSCENCTHMTGIELFSSSRGYYTETKCFFKYPFKKNKLQASFEILKEEILQQRPVLIQIFSSGLVHTMVGIGFIETPQGSFIIAVIPGISIRQSTIENSYFYNWDGKFDNLSITTVKPHLISNQNKTTGQSKTQQI